MMPYWLTIAAFGHTDRDLLIQHTIPCIDYHSRTNSTTPARLARMPSTISIIIMLPTHQMLSLVCEAPICDISSIARRHKERAKTQKATGLQSGRRCFLERAGRCDALANIQKVVQMTRHPCPVTAIAVYYHPRLTCHGHCSTNGRQDPALRTFTCMLHTRRGHAQRCCTNMRSPSAPASQTTSSTTTVHSGTLRLPQRPCCAAASTSQLISRQA